MVRCTKEMGLDSIHTSSKAMSQEFNFSFGDAPRFVDVLNINYDDYNTCL